MTNKEKYKQAFSVLHPSGKLSLEVEKMTMIQNKKKKFRAAAAATAACLFVACGGGIAYAADAFGVQRKVQVWLNGDLTDATLEFQKDGSYLVRMDSTQDGLSEEFGGGGVVIDDDGSERPMTESEIMDSLNDPQVEYKEDGTVWVYYYDQKIEITDRFENGVCYVKLTNGEETLYMTIKYQDGYCTNPHKYQDPDTL